MVLDMAGSSLHHACEATCEQLCSDLGHVARLVPTGSEGESTSIKGYSVLRYLQLKQALAVLYTVQINA